MTRREFLIAALTVPGAVAVPGTVNTTAGPVALDALGVTLAHEHVLVDFVGAERVSPSRYDRDAAFARALPHLERIYSLGCRTLVECTPAYLGRDPELLRRLSRASKLHILTNTGYYGAANDKFLPPHAFTEDPDRLAARWIREARHGIDGTGIMPAFMKIGVDAGPLSDVDRKLVRAAARTRRATGLPIYSHTGNGVAALAQVAVLDEERAPLSAFVWVHAQNESDRAVHAQVGRRGAWVSFDGVSAQTLDRHLDNVLAMRDARLLDRVLVSHDAGWYHVGEPDGGTYRPHDLIFTELLPALRARGFTSGEITQLMVENPRRALTPSL
jgi:predicted metal-dependent phosphotriesterase family hydrolase